MLLSSVIFLALAAVARATFTPRYLPATRVERSDAEAERPDVELTWCACGCVACFERTDGAPVCMPCSMDGAL